MKIMSKYDISSIEFNLSHACNLKCANCDHLSPYFSAKNNNKFVDYEKFLRQVTVLTKHARVNSFSFLGGEPLLKKDIVKYLKAVKDTGICKKLVLVTNGFLLPKMHEEAYKYLDQISVSTYPSPVLDRESLKVVEKTCRKHNVNIEYHRHDYFCYNVVSKEIQNSNLVHKIFMTCSLAWKQHCHTLFDNKISRCSRLPFMNLKLLEKGCIESDFIESDCLEIIDSSGFAKRLREYLESDTPLQSCRYCLGSVGKSVKHKQLTPKEVADEIWTEVIHNGSINWIKLYRKLIKRKLLERI